MFNNIYDGKKVFITGHTGFKGTWLSLWLHKLNAKVCGYALKQNTIPSMFEELSVDKLIDKSVEGNILDVDLLKHTIEEFEPDIVFHLAAQPLVRYSYQNPKETYETNVIGTLNVLEVARKVKTIKAFINITTDKCYENKEENRLYKEDDILGGHDIYSSSKACSEILSSSYKRSFLQENNSMLLATARAGNVIGGGDWASDRLIPDCIKSINQDIQIELRNPNSIRPWQFVLEPLSGYLLLGQKLLENKRNFAQSFNFGPKTDSCITVEQIVKKVIDNYGKGCIIINKKDNLHEAGLLMLDVEKAKKILNWSPTYDINEVIEQTVTWYKKFYEKDINMNKLTIKQIEQYERSINWN